MHWKAFQCSVGEFQVSFSSKDNKTQGSRRYTTRQIMELTEKRRKQMDEDARLRKLLAPLAEEAVQEQPQDPSLSPQRPQSDGPVDSVPAEPIDLSPASEKDRLSTENIADEEKTETESDEPSESLIGKSEDGFLNEEFNDPLKDSEDVLIEIPPKPIVDSTQKEASVEDNPALPAAVQEDFKFFSAQSLESENFNFKNRDDLQARQRPPLGKFHRIVLQIFECLFVGLSLILTSLMFTHVLSIGWAKHYYDQSPFVLLVVLCMLWINRSHLKKREEWFWGSSVIVAGGLGVFMAAALEGHVYIELAGFVIVSFGLLLWRYQEESACRLLFPLLGFLFVFAPPIAWEQSLIAPFNDLVYHLSAWAVNSFHIPVDYDGHQFHVAGSTILFQGDPTVFRSMYIGLLLAIACLSFQNLAIVSSVALFASVALWAFFANIVRIATTGLIMENFGLDYATNFYAEYSFYMVLVVMLAGISLTAGLLPHKEDFD